MPDDDFFNFTPADSSDYIVAADTGGAPPTDASGSASSFSFGGLLDTAKQYAGGALDTAKTYYQLQLARGQQNVQLATAQSALDQARSKATSDREVALLNGRAAVAAAQTKAN